MRLKLTTDGQSVHGTREDGTYVSYLTTASEYIAWLSSGNTPEPAKTQEEIEAEARVARLAEIDARLVEIDKLKVRPLSEMMLAPASEFAREKLESLEAEARVLRAERTGLI